MKDQDTPPGSLSVSHFTQHEDVQKYILELKKRNIIVSDTLDQYGNQYVNLVQKGGGVWGIALVGYTYVLEEVGIRFLKLAGTSAGAINTALLSMIGTADESDHHKKHHKSGKKSGKIIEYLINLNMFDFVDGHPFARWFIKTLIRNKSFVKQVQRILLVVVMVLGLLLIADIVSVALSPKSTAWNTIGTISFILTGLNILLFTGIVIYLRYLVNRLKTSGYGINPGDFFYNWIKDRWEENGIKTISDLEARIAIPIPGLKLRHDHPMGAEGLSGEVSIIASELVTENKIEFPRMWDLFKVNKNDLHPARFVRSSMSIPVFFESHMIVGIEKDHPSIQNAWDKYFGETSIEKIPSEVRFVDGGLLSNFPVNIFYNPKVPDMPRLPSFGIDLYEQKEMTKDKNDKNTGDPLTWSIGNYLGRMLNTMRNYYDKDFMLKNKVFKLGIGRVNLYGYNWLNFFLTDKEKIELFVKGAEAAKEFLLSFDWDAYKEQRATMQHSLTVETKDFNGQTSSGV